MFGVINFPNCMSVLIGIRFYIGGLHDLSPEDHSLITLNTRQFDYKKLHDFT